MGTDLTKLRNRLSSLKESTRKVGGLWKPKGKHQIRIVPYKYNPENPFIELRFHYDLGGKNYLSPVSFGDADPIVEFAEKMRATGDTESYKLSRKLMPKMRTYVPVIVRGEEEEGVRFWGFSKSSYEEILEIISDPEYGDIVDIKNGTDLEVTYVTPEEAGTTYGKITVRAKRKSSPLTDNPEQLKKWLDDQQEITEIYKVLNYDDLKDALQEYLDIGDGDGGEPEEETSNAVEIEEKDDDETVSSATEAFNKLFDRSSDK